MSKVNTHLKSKQMDALILSDQDLQALASLHAAPAAIKRGKPVRVKLSNGDHVLVTFDERVDASSSKERASVIPGKVREVSAKMSRFGVTKRHRDEMDDLEALQQSMTYAFGEDETPKPAS
jgi:1,2-phenylacetyl-CoA epoxidase PaaB subunit